MIEELPSEVVIEILKNLPTNDLLSISLVSKRFFELSTDPLLWRNFEIQYATPDILGAKLKVPRFRKLRALQISNFELMPFLEDESEEGRRNFTAEELKTILELLKSIDLKELHLSHLNLHEIDKELLSEVIRAVQLIQ